MGRAQAHGSAAKYAALGLGLAALWASVGVPGARADAPLTLIWAAPEACPQQPAVQAEVQRLLGGPGAAGAGVRVSGQVSAASDGQYVLMLVVHTGAGEATRTLEGASCESLAQAGALVVALAIDPEGVAARGADAGATEIVPGTPTETATEAGTGTNTGTQAGTEAAPATDAGVVTGTEAGTESGTRTEAQRATSPARGPRVRGRVLVHAVGEAFAVPGLSGGLVAGGGLRVGIVDGSLEVLWAASQTIAVPPSIAMTAPPDAGADFTLLAGRVRGCVALTGRVVELAPCLGFEVGGLQGASRGVSALSSGWAHWLAPLAGAELRVFAVDFVAITARVDAAIPLGRPTFRIDGVGRVTEAGIVSVRVELGASLYFP